MRKKIWERPLLALMLLWLGLSGIPSQASERVYYFHNDHLGTPQAMSDASGRVVWTAEYDPFGKATVNEDPDGNGQIVENNLRFPGQYYDAETGLHYNYHRDYDPATGRYLTPDPIGVLGLSPPNPTIQVPTDFSSDDTNLYGYALGNPVSKSDPRGLFVVADDLLLIGGAAILAGGVCEFSRRWSDTYGPLRNAPGMPGWQDPTKRNDPEGARKCIEGCRKRYKGSFFLRLTCITGCVFAYGVSP